MAKYSGWEEKMWNNLNRDKKLQAAVIDRAHKTARRATELSRESGGTANYSVTSGIRPGGRFYASVVSDNGAEEQGTEEVPRTNALRRAVRGG